MYDTAISGGRVVSEMYTREANVYIANGKIAAVTAEERSARERVDALGLLVFPGMIDSHVHFMDPGDNERETFLTGSAAAACAGITSIVEHTHSHPIRTWSDFEEKATYLTGRSYVDFGLAAHAWPDKISEVDRLWRAGVVYMKGFTCTTHGVPGLDAERLSELFRTTSRLGAPCLVHCEDESMTGAAETNLRSLGRRDPGLLCEWRNRAAEATATVLTAFLARRHRARVVIAHASNPEILAIARRERTEGGDIRVESCPQYLLLREDELLEHGSFRKFTPPARAQSSFELELMWKALAEGEIHHISSDHAPSTREQKLEGSIWDVHFGLPGIDTTFSVLLDAAHRGLVSYERIADAYSAAPARAYGLGSSKGVLEEGYDADIVLVDPHARWTVADEDIRSRAGWSPFAGRTFTGRPVKTFLRGELIADDRQVTASPAGNLIRGAGATA